MSSKFNYYGSISHGTMREEDLIPVFLEVLADIAPEVAEDIIDEYNYNAEVFDYSSEDATHMLNEALFTALDYLSPDGYYFSAHPGDGSNYGFWEHESEY